MLLILLHSFVVMCWFVWVRFVAGLLFWLWAGIWFGLLWVMRLCYYAAINSVGFLLFGVY